MPTWLPWERCGRAAPEAAATSCFATLGTGVGGGIIIGGKVIAGSHGAGGEIGHIHVEEDAEEEVCNCGNKGCLEQMASATGIVRLARRHLAASDEPSLLRDKSKKLSAKLVFDAVKEGDALACEIADQFGWYLGKAFAQIAGVVDPEVFVLGGGVSKAGPILIDYVRKYYLQYVFPHLPGGKLYTGSAGEMMRVSTAQRNWC